MKTQDLFFWSSWNWWWKVILQPEYYFQTENIFLMFLFYIGLLQYKYFGMVKTNKVTSWESLCQFLVLLIFCNFACRYRKSSFKNWDEIIKLSAAVERCMCTTTVHRLQVNRDICWTQAESVASWWGLALYLINGIVHTILTQSIPHQLWPTAVANITTILLTASLTHTLLYISHCYSSNKLS